MNVQTKGQQIKASVGDHSRYYHSYLALDWSLDNTAIAWMGAASSRPRVVQLAPQIKTIKAFARQIRGPRILCIEETTGTHWLYVELRDAFDKILVCDPYRNRLLSEGAKTDKIDASKLCQLLRAGLLKEVYHSLDDDYYIRQLVSAYEDWIQFGTRFKNQKSALYRSVGLQYRRDTLEDGPAYVPFIGAVQDEAIRLYAEKKEAYARLFRRVRKGHPIISNLYGISGIHDIWAVTLYGIVIDAHRFATKYHYWAYCGLVTHEKESGGRRYGKRSPRYCRKLKCVYKSAAMAAIRGKNDIRDYYEFLLSQGISAWNARHEVARYIAKVSYGMMKHQSPYHPYQWRKNRKEVLKQTASALGPTL